MGHVFGIDLGTTYSCIAYIDEYGRPEVLKNSEGNRTTPSVVMIRPTQDVVVGEEAKRSVEIEPEQVIQFIKRKMGREDDKVTVNGGSYSAPEISAYILKKLVQDANAELRQSSVLKEGEEVRDVVITCPAYFGMNERQATKTAGELAGLNVLNIINEPTAAAISYGALSKGRDETVLIYDLGGGTFDITVMNVHKNDITVICTGGDDQLGGKNWDEALMDYVAERYQEEYGVDILEDEEMMSTLYVDVENWKKALTARESVKIAVNGPAGRMREDLTREQYEEITRSLLYRTKNLVDETLKTAAKKGFPLAKIDKFLLVGGSSRMPQVAEMIQKDYHKTPMLQDPDEAVAKGAAIFASQEREFQDFVEKEAKKARMSIKSFTEEDLRRGGGLEKKFAKLSAGKQGTGKLAIKNVLSRTYGVTVYESSESDNFIILNLLKCNDPLPAKGTKSVATREDNQSGTMLEICETRSMEDQIPYTGQKPVAKVDMKFLRPVPGGTEIVVDFMIDSSGILHVSAEEMYAHSKLATSFALSGQMSDGEMGAAASRLKKVNIE